MVNSKSRVCFNGSILNYHCPKKGATDGFIKLIQDQVVIRCFFDWQEIGGDQGKVAGFQLSRLREFFHGLRG